MSLYDKGEPIKTQEYRDKTHRDTAYAGVEYQYSIQCHGGCGQRKPQAGGTRIDGKFVCAGCRVPAAIGA